MSATLFLDFDGVLRPVGPIQMEDGARIAVNPQLFPWLPILTELLDGRQVSIVVSSDWARICDDDALGRLLGPLAERVADVLPGNPGDDRARRIKQYVSQRGLHTWLAIDDDPSVRKAARASRHFLWCRGDNGISDLAVQAALRKWLRPLFGTLEVRGRRGTS